MNQFSSTDIIIVGAGVVGLAHALACAKKGLKVHVFERNSFAVGASVRNFGMIWSIGQPQGKMLNRALRNRELWTEIAQEAHISLDMSGSLHLAYRSDEWKVLEEFFQTTQGSGYKHALLSSEETLNKSQAVNPSKLLGALWSETEMTVDPREAIRKLPSYLSEKYNVTFHFGKVVTEISYPMLRIGDERWKAEQIFVCSGADFETLYPHIYSQSGMTKVKLQMMRTIPQPNNWKLGPCLCAGLTLTHYQAFSHCSSLPKLKERIEQETPYFPKWGIHVLLSQTPAGELTIGDSHEYGLNPEPFDKEIINRYILDYLRTFLVAPSFEIAETWHGIYPKINQQTEFIAQPEKGVMIVNGLGGAGMTLSFALAEEIVNENL